MLLKDLTGFVEPEEPAKVTIDAGCQTIVYEEPRAKKELTQRAALVVDFDITADPSEEHKSRVDSAKLKTQQLETKRNYSMDDNVGLIQDSSLKNLDG